MDTPQGFRLIDVDARDSSPLDRCGLIVCYNFPHELHPLDKGHATPSGSLLSAQTTQTTAICTELPDALPLLS